MKRKELIVVFERVKERFSLWNSRIYHDSVAYNRDIIDMVEEVFNHILLELKEE